MRAHDDQFGIGFLTRLDDAVADAQEASLGESHLEWNAKFFGHPMRWTDHTLSILFGGVFDQGIGQNHMRTEAFGELEPKLRGMIAAL